MKCKAKDLCDDLILLGVTEINFDFSGFALVIADELKYRGVKVTDTRKMRFKK